MVGDVQVDDKTVVLAGTPGGGLPLGDELACTADFLRAGARDKDGPSAASPLSLSVRGPMAPASTAGTSDGGHSSATSSRCTYRPSADSRSPASRARSAARYSRSSVIGDSAAAPVCRIQSWRPCPTPIVTRPGNRRCSMAVSIAAVATFRSGTGSTPIPTRRLVVQARAAEQAGTAPPQKQSSHSHSSSSPAASAATATFRNCSGGTCGRHTAPRVVMWTSSWIATPSESPGIVSARRAAAASCRLLAGRAGLECRWVVVVFEYQLQMK